MTKLIAASAGIVAAAGVASAQLQVFEIQAGLADPNSVDPSIDDAAVGIQLDGGGAFYQDAAFGEDVAPNPALLDAFPDLAFDSYVALGGEPIVDATSTPGPELGFATGTPFSGDGVVSGVWFVTNQGDEIPSEPSDAIGGEFDVYLGRFVGGSISGVLSIGNLTEGGSDDPVGDEFFQFLLPLDGSVVTPQDSVQSYRARIETSDSPFGQVNDLYIEALPSPGAAGLLGLAGLAAARRRR